MQPLDAILSIATDLTSSSSSKERYDRLLGIVKSMVKSDAAALLLKEGDSLRMLSCSGMSPSALHKPYPLAEHPRLSIIAGSKNPVLFPPDSPLPDPFDPFLGAKWEEGGGHLHVHSCLGCPLIVEGELVGVLTADSLKVGAFATLDLPFLSTLGALAGAAVRTSRLVEALENVAEKRGLVARDLMQSVNETAGSFMIGVSPSMEKLREEIRFAGQCDLPVLITGETGTGKELVARSIQAASLRKDDAMIYVNCAALPETIVESELFGHLRGAFTGAMGNRAGKFEVADGGTIFLDEIGELPLSVQAKLLRVLQEGEIQRVGSDKLLKVNVRIIAATNRDLEDEVRRGRFRADLYYRLNVYRIKVPPLREHKQDIIHLSGYFCDLNHRKLDVGLVQIHPSAMKLLMSYPWPGNVRELRNVLDRTLLKAKFRRPGQAVLELLATDLPSDLRGDALSGELSPLGVDQESGAAKAISLREATEEFQRNLVKRAVKRSAGNWALAAKSLGLHRSNLFALSKRLGLK